MTTGLLLRSTRSQIIINYWEHSLSGSSHGIVAETGRHFAVDSKKHKYNLTQGLLEKSKWAERAYERGHTISLKEVQVLQIEQNTSPHVSGSSSD
jgi:phage I-like protein